MTKIHVAIEIGERLWSVTFSDGASYQISATSEPEARRKARAKYRREFGNVTHTSIYQDQVA